MIESAGYFGVFLRICLTEYVAALGMADHDKVNAHFIQHKRGDLAGELPLLLPAHILRAQPDQALVDLPGDGVQTGIGRDDEKVDVIAADIRGQLGQPGEIVCSLADRLVHFQIGSKI